MMNWLKKLMLFRRLISIIQFFKKTDYDTKIGEFEKKIFDHDQKKVCMTLNYIEHFLTLVFAVTGCMSLSVFASLVDISMGIVRSTKGLSICTRIAKI